jgi:hypothetical protein
MTQPTKMRHRATGIFPYTSLEQEIADEEKKYVETN